MQSAQRCIGEGSSKLLENLLGDSFWGTERKGNTDSRTEFHETSEKVMTRLCHHGFSGCLDGVEDCGNGGECSLCKVLAKQA